MRGNINKQFLNSSLCNGTNSAYNLSTKNLIALLSLQSIYKEVFKLIKSNLHLIKNMTAEDKQALNSKSNIKLDEIIKNIKSWTYSCEPIYIKKSNLGMFRHITKLNYLAIPSLKDIILQTSIKLLIEFHCEKKKIFNNQSFGFRSNRSLHDALNSIKNMKGVTWMIESRIYNFFDNINYNILINIIKNKLNPDRTLIGIFNKLFNVGPLINPYFDIISPILFNIYLTPLDEFIDKLKESYTISPFPIKIYYVRFANEWVIGVVGDDHNYKELIKIKEQIKTFLKDKLKLALEKNELTHLGRDNANFLGHHLRLSKPKYHNSPNSYLGPAILIPFNDLKSKLVEKGFAYDSGFPKYVGKLLHLSDYDLVKYYDSLLTNILIFYSMTDNCSDLRELLYILEYSLAHTLAAKHRSSLAKIFKKYGKPIVVNSPQSDGKVKFTKPSKAVYLNNQKFNLELEMWKLEYNTNNPISVVIDLKNNYGKT